MPDRAYYSWEQDVIDRLSRIEERINAVKADAEDHEKRIRSIETKQWALAPLAATFGACLAPLLAKLGVHLPGVLPGAE